MLPYGTIAFAVHDFTKKRARDPEKIGFRYFINMGLFFVIFGVALTLFIVLESYSREPMAGDVLLKLFATVILVMFAFGELYALFSWFVILKRGKFEESSEKSSK